MATAPKGTTYRVKVGSVVTGAGKKQKSIEAPGIVELDADDAARLIDAGIVEPVGAAPAAAAPAQPTAEEVAAAEAAAAAAAAAAPPAK